MAESTYVVSDDAVGSRHVLGEVAIDHRQFVKQDRPRLRIMPIRHRQERGMGYEENLATFLAAAEVADDVLLDLTRTARIGIDASDANVGRLLVRDRKTVAVGLPDQVLGWLNDGNLFAKFGALNRISYRGVGLPTAA